MELDQNFRVGLRAQTQISSRRRGSKRLRMVAITLTMVCGVLALATTPASAAISLTASPNTGLTNGQTVTVTGSGFAKSSIGDVVECNSDPSQPTVALPSPISETVPVSCSAPDLAKLINTDANGGVSTTYAVISGTVGPPCGPSPAATTCPSTDSAGNSPTADAPLYPCPPTAAQQAAGDTCNLSYGDAAGESGKATIAFTGEAPASSTPTPAATTPAATTPAATTPAATTPAATAPSATTPAATAPASSAPLAAAQTSASPSASDSSLASTGPGPQLWLVALAGLLLLYLGLMTLALVGRRRSLLRRLLHLAGPIPDTPGSAIPNQGPTPTNRGIVRDASRTMTAYPEPGSSQRLWF
jgi:hypothetical protein